MPRDIVLIRPAVRTHHSRPGEHPVRSERVDEVPAVEPALCYPDRFRVPR